MQNEKSSWTKNLGEIQDTMRRPNLRIIGIEESKDSHLNDPVNFANQIIGENFPSLKREIPMVLQEAYRTQNRFGQKRNSSHHIIIKTANAQN